MDTHHAPPTSSRGFFPTAERGAPFASPTGTRDLEDGDHLTLHVAPATMRISGREVRMLAYDGSVPGPLLRVPEGAEVTVTVVNDGDLETTVHWHGLRLDNAADGTNETQAPVAVGGAYTTRVRFPDPGVYWYHPHIREDYAQEMGLYGACIVTPADPDYWPRVHREIVLTLDDVLLEGDAVAPFRRDEPTYVAMGRFGDHVLVGGETDLALTARVGEVVRVYLVNTANTRVFRVALPGAVMKLVGGDSGRVERQVFVDDVTLAPSERAVVDVLFPDPGEFALEHRAPGGSLRLASVAVDGPPIRPDLRDDFVARRIDPDLTALREQAMARVGSRPDRTLTFVAEMDSDRGAHATHGSSHHPGHRPAPQVSRPGVPPRDDGIEWEDDMVEMNRLSTPSSIGWHIVDAETGARGADIAWRFRVGDTVLIRLVNGEDSDHPMHHPFHIHGAGRFVVLTRDGEPERNLMWKDTVLVRRGETVEILLEVTNPGRWMAHCHIAEHHEGGMSFSFDVDPG
jgi:FtsP/CotA-like multicopper oxidase with cupredoxin domain